MRRRTHERRPYFRLTPGETRYLIVLANPFGRITPHRAEVGNRESAEAQAAWLVLTDVVLTCLLYPSKALENAHEARADRGEDSFLRRRADEHSGRRNLTER